MNGTRHHTARRWIVTGVAALLWLASYQPSSVCADALDQEIFEQGIDAKIIRQAYKQGYKNLGFLNFEVQIGSAEPSLRVGRLNASLPMRFENALILKMPLENGSGAKLGVIRNAGGEAVARNPKANFRTEAGRAELFQQTYPLAWGNEKVAPDAFLLGLVKVAENLRTAEVQVRIFDRKNPAEVRDLAKFDVKTDRSFLEEINQNFVISKRTLNALMTKGGANNTIAADDVDTAALAEGKKSADNDLQKMLEFLDLMILINGQPTPIVNGQIANPPVGAKITFKVRAKERLGLLLRVNGVNSLNEERDILDPKLLSWWILQPGKEFEIPGFFVQKAGKQFEFKPFLAQEETAVSQAELGPPQYLGRIDFDIFLDKTALASPTAPNLPEVKIVSRGGMDFRRVNPQETTFEKTKQALTKIQPRGSLITGSAGGNVNVELGSFQGDFHLGSFHVRYRDKGGN